MMWFEMFDQQQRDELCRINTLGMQQAAGALSQLLGQPVRLEASGAVLAEQPQSGLDESELGLGVYLGVNGELNGGMLLFFSEVSAGWLSCRLLGRAKLENLLAEPVSSTLKEVGNIIASAFLASLDSQLKLRALPSPPELFLAPLAELLEQQRGSQDFPGPTVCNRLSSAGGPADSLQATIYLFPETEVLDLLLERVASENS